MKILIVIDQFDDANNGTTISAKRFAKGLEDLGHEVYIVSTGKKANNKYVVKKMPLPIIISGIIKSQGMVFAVPNKKLLREAISSVDVVHFYMPFLLSKEALKIAEELNVPHTAAFHVQPENITYTAKLGKSKRINDDIYKFYRNKFFNRFKYIHCPSNFIANQLKSHGYTAKTYVISNGVGSEFVYRKNDKKDEFKDKFVITMIGRLSNEKRQDLIFEAISKSKYSDKIELVLAGRGPNYKKYVKLGEKLVNKPVIDFFAKEDLLNLLGMTDLYIHSADAEIEAISCIEAFACGIVPVISNSKQSATPQFALDERSLFEAGNSDDLAKKIDYWIEHEKERKEMEFEYAKNAENYRIEKSMKKIEGMFEDAIRDNKEERKEKEELKA